MSNFLAPAIPAERLLSSRLRVHAVVGDAMEPLFRGGRDYALLAPVDTFKGEGVYALDTSLGIELFRVTIAFDGKGGLRLSRENPRYQSHDISRERFDALVVAITVADIKVRDERFLVDNGGN
ncbi:hypothetical protein QO004_000487 [Rhizobium mesoamericanum]|uniref:hypothetical protein n=1 Tax=Rhizobium mesoamericanum TaxID=1079800 RepID=UPI002780C0F9|nr:hypothetical protein [Rhizobium mesoamericanum]MDQ0558712.1 hypothetical protein [Rhizobium mesoamericanum]